MSMTNDRQDLVTVMAVPTDPSRIDVDGHAGWLTAAQVAELLGVKRATVYAYVSRGLLHRRLALDGRTSLFDRNEVEGMRSGRRSTPPGELRAVLASGITRVAEDSILIRGRSLTAAVEGGIRFTQIADLIWGGDNTDLWADLFGSAPSAAETGGSPPTGPSDLLAAAGDKLSPLDRLRLAVIVAANADPLRHDLSAPVVRRTGPRLIKAMIEGLPSVDPGGREFPDHNDWPVAGALWARLSTTTPSVAKLHCLDAALALLADHGLAASTFACRVAASTRADPYAVVGTGLGVVSGPLHGAASSAVHDVLARLADHDDPLADHDDPLVATTDKSSSGQGLPGFGHSIYRRQDPRFAVMSRLVNEAWNGDRRLMLVERYHRAATERTDAPANVDLVLGALTLLADMSPQAGEIIFAVARTSGWLGHAIEEYGERPLRIRPKAQYTGPMTG